MQRWIFLKKIHWDYSLQWHHMSIISSQITDNLTVCSPAYSIEQQWKMKALHHWPSERNSLVTKWFPSQVPVIWQVFSCHYNDVIMSIMASQITSLTIITQPFIQAQIKENIKALCHWPLCGEFTGDRWIPRTKGQWCGKCFHLMTSSCHGIIKSLTLVVLSMMTPGLILLKTLISLSGGPH